MYPCPVCGLDRDGPEAACPRCSQLSGVRPDETATFVFSGRKGRRTLGDADLKRGDLFGERYQIDGFLGRGGTGSVYRAIDTTTGEPKALKILHAEASSDPKKAARANREFEILKSLDHPSIPKTDAWGESEGLRYTAGELVEGVSLGNLLKQRVPWSAEETAKLGMEVAGALAIAHAAGVVHRDVKPQNIMVSENGPAKLLDFGLARAQGAESLTAAGMAVGTPGYMSPEQLSGSDLDGRSDIYSLGVVLFRMLTGVLPLQGRNAAATAMLILSQPAPALREVRGEIPEWIDEIVTKCLQRDRAKRFKHAVALASSLRIRRIAD